MRTKLSVSLNNKALYNVDSSIIIQGIDEQMVNLNPTAASRAGLNGQRYISTEKRYRDVVVSFAINERSYTKRRTVFGKVCKWARDGGTLWVGYRDTMTALYVVCTALPALGNVAQWANPLQMTFRAYDIPEWIEVLAVQQNGTTSTANTFLCNNPGEMPTKLEIEFSNTSGSTCNTVTVTSEGQKIRLTSLGLASGVSLYISYDTRDIQSIKIKNGSGVYRSVLAKRTVDSVDDIWMPPGDTYVTAQSDVALTYRYYVRGRYD